jgi:hypothetical protein
MTAKQISDRIEPFIPEDTDVITLAEAVAIVLKNQYGEHNYSLFIQTLNNKLNGN